MLLVGVMFLFFVSAVPYLKGGAPFGDDNSAHYALCLHISRLLLAGETDFFWGQANLGLPLFASYQPLPSILTGALMTLMPESMTLFFFKAVVLFFWAAMPLTWYVGGRWMGMSRLTATILGLLTITIRTEWSVGFSITSSAFEGLFTQAWGFWFFPLAVGAFYRCVVCNTLAWSWAAVFLSLTMMSHLFAGLLVLLTFGCIVVVQPKQIQYFFRPTAFVGCGAFGLCAFWLIPLLWSRDYLGGLPWLNDNYDGWSLTKTATAFLSGHVLDFERLPVISSVAFLFAFCSLRHIRTSHQIKAAWLFGMITWLLMGGREVWGTWFVNLPMHAHINPIRYLSGLQVVGIVAAAHGFSAVWRRASAKLSRSQIVLVLIVSTWALLQYHFVQRVFKTKPWFNSPIHRVAGELAADPQHRFMVDGSFGTGNHFHRDLLPALAGRAQLQSYALGYHATLSTFYAEHVRLDAQSLRLFNVNSLVTRNNAKVPSVFQFYREIGPYKIYKVPDSSNWGYFDLVWPGTKVIGPLRDMRPHLQTMAPELFAKQHVAVLQSSPREKLRVEPTTLQKRAPKGHIISQEIGLNQYQTTVTAEPGTWLLLKVNFFPFWRATVDGKETRIHHVGPNFMAVELPGGKHQVVFSYHNPWAQKAGAVVSFLLYLFWLGWILRRLRL